MFRHRKNTISKNPFLLKRKKASKNSNILLLSGRCSGFPTEPDQADRLLAFHVIDIGPLSGAEIMDTGQIHSNSGLFQRIRTTACGNPLFKLRLEFIHHEMWIRDRFTFVISRQSGITAINGIFKTPAISSGEILKEASYLSLIHIYHRRLSLRDPAQT